MPNLLAKIQEFIASRADHDLLFDIPAEANLAVWANDQLKGLFRSRGLVWEESSHGFRRGCTSALVSLGVNDRVICRHLGWAAGSSMISVYCRNVELE